MYWYNRYASKIAAKLSSKEAPTSIAKWSMFTSLPKGSVLGPLFFLHKWLNKEYFINQQTFCWWYLHFLYCNDIDNSEHELKSKLRKISMWAYQWKMSFNSDVSKPAQQVIFYKKTKKLFYPTVLFNNIHVQRRWKT